jgi:hypothetical protein
MGDIGKPFFKKTTDGERRLTAAPPKKQQDLITRV